MTSPSNPSQPTVKPVVQSSKSRMRRDKAFRLLCLSATMLAILVLIVLLLSILTQGLSGLNLDFLMQGNSSSPEEAGVKISLVGSILVVAFCALAAIPLGVGTAILIEEYRPRNPILLKLHGFVETNIRNLAGVPSIVYGILGASAFAMMFGIFGPMGQSNFAIGQDWYDLYVAEDRHTYVIPRDGAETYDPTSLPASPDLVMYTSMDLTEKAPELTWITKEDVEPIRERIQEDMPAFVKTLKDEVAKTKVGRKPSIDQAKAEAIADAAIEAGTWESDPAEFREKLITAIQAIDGTGFKDRITMQNRAIAVGVDAEYSYRVPNTMMIGKEPVRVDQKYWYYLSLPFGRGVLTGGLTLMLVILPIIIVASQEALRAVPGSYRQGALALGATKWQSISKTALPAAIPGICTGTILAISRAIGEAAPLLAIGGVGYVTTTPSNLMDRFSALPLNIYKWSGEPNVEFQNVAASGIIVLLIVLLSFNALAIYIRQRASKHQ